MRHHIEFFRQFRSRFETTGAIAPSSRFLANAMTRPLRDAEKPVRVLEVGPGTGAVTSRIVELLGPNDHLDLVELNESFADILRQRFDSEKRYQAVADQAAIHVCALQEFHAEDEYDFIISGLPLNNFPTELVQEIFAAYFRHLKPGGVLSYFEYMYVRPIRTRVGKASERLRMQALTDVLAEYLSRHRFDTDWVFANLPPAWVQHLRNDDVAAAE